MPLSLPTLGLRESTALVLWGVAALLVVGSVLRLAWPGADRSSRPDRLRSLTTWWILVALVVICVVLGPPAIVLLLGVLSLLALLEYVVLTDGPVRAATLAWMIPVVAVQYLSIWFGWTTVALVAIPLGLFAALAAWGSLVEPSGTFLRRIPLLHWGALLTVYAPAHAARLTMQPPSGGNGGPEGWFVFLVLTVALNDIAQAIVGRRFGRHGIASVSPNKTWAGFLGGLLTTIALAALLAPWLTSLADPVLFGVPHLAAVVAGLVIGVSGFLGDLHVSAIKRSVGAKDSGDLLPGQGGILDRIDSLTLAAPALYYYVLLVERLGGRSG